MAKRWGKDIFLGYIKMLEEEIARETNLDRLAYLEYSLCSLKGTYYSYFTNPIREIEKTSLRSQLYTIDYNLRIYPKYYEIIEEFFNRTSGLQKKNTESFKVSGSMPTNVFDSLTTTTLTVDEAIEGTRAFYSGFDRGINERFKKIFAYRDKFLFTIPKKQRNVFLDKKGNTGDSYFVSGLDKTFILVRDCENEETFTSLVHEYGHAIKNDYVPRYVTVDGGQNFFYEVESIFPEICASYDNPLGFGDGVVAASFFDRFQTYFDMADDLNSHRKISQLYAKKRYRVSDDFKKELEDYAELTKFGLDSSLDCEIDGDGVYVLSYIVALELFHIYKQDKKEALRIFKEILKIKNPDDSLTRIKSLIRLNEHAAEECELAIDERTKVLSKVK